MELLQSEALPEWIDYNGHMNVAYFVQVFDQAVDRFLDLYGLGKDYTLAGKGSVFAVQNHIHYLREVSQGTRLAVEFRLLGLDGKRLHFFMWMRDLSNSDVVATSEMMAIHVEWRSRSAGDIPAPQRDRLNELLEEHNKLAAPRLAGRAIGIGAKLSL